MRILAGYKFAIIGQTVSPQPPKINFPLRFDGQLWVTSEPPLAIDDTWQSWLGLQSRRFSESNLFLVATAPSDSPTVLDHENIRLDNLARQLYVALAIEGLFFGDKGLVVSGARRPELRSVEVRSVSETSQFFHPRGYHGLTVTEELLLKSEKVANNLGRLLQIKPVPRMLKGVHSLMAGLESRFGGQRLHSFVRSIDALMMLTQGKSTVQFVKRGRVFAGSLERTKDVLMQMYLLRCAEEHMKPPDSVLKEHFVLDIPRIAMQRALQAELLAKHVYGRILESDSLTSLFSDDRWLERLWTMDEELAAKEWGRPVNLHGVDPPPFDLREL